MGDFIGENVLKAVDAMYSPHPVPNYKDLDLWLKSFQKSHEA